MIKIYKAENTVNNKVYIGSTKRDLKKRITSHYDLGKRFVKGNYKHSDDFFPVELTKFTKDIFKWSILEEVSNRPFAIERENFYIKQYNSIETGYNHQLAGDCNDGIDREDLKDHTIYKFVNMKSGESYIGKQSDFIKEFDLYQPGINRMVNGFRPHYQHWLIDGTQEKYKKYNGLLNVEIKMFNFVTQDVFEGTAIDFCIETGVSQSSISALLHRYTKTVKREWCLYEFKHLFSEKF